MPVLQFPAHEQLREDLKKFPRVTAEEAARMDAEMPPCDENAPNPRRLGRMDNLDDLTDEMRKKYNLPKREEG